MPLSLKNYCLLLCGAIAFARCADLKEVSAFGLTSQQVMDRNKSATFGYYAYYHDSAFIYNYLPDHLRDVDCHCDAEKTADANIAKEYALLSTYFGILAKFADPKAAINFGPLGAPLPAGTYGHVTVSTTEAGIASGLATGLTALATTEYKAKKIKPFMAAYRDSVAPLLTLLKIRADNIAGKIINLQLQLDRVTDSLITYAAHKEVKMPVLFVYEQKRKELDLTLAAYQQREQELDNIIAGGQLIVDHLDNLHDKNFKDKMMSLVNAIALNANVKF